MQSRLEPRRSRHTPARPIYHHPEPAFLGTPPSQVAQTPRLFKSRPRRCDCMQRDRKSSCTTRRAAHPADPPCDDCFLCRANRQQTSAGADGIPDVSYHVTTGLQWKSEPSMSRVQESLASCCEVRGGGEKSGGGKQHRKGSATTRQAPSTQRRPHQEAAHAMVRLSSTHSSCGAMMKL